MAASVTTPEQRRTENRTCPVLLVLGATMNYITFVGNNDGGT